MTNNHEELIEEAAKAIADVHNVGAFEMYPAGWVKEAEAAFAVFEQSHTPCEALPNDEREALARALFIASDDFAFADRMAKSWDAPGEYGRARWFTYADAVLAAGFRRPVQGESECQEAPVSENVAGQMSVQGELCGISEQLEPTDAQVKAGLDAYFGCDFYDDYPSSVQYHEPSMRRALRAAFATEQGENR